MKYQQASVSRLSAAGKKFVNDGEWHPFESDDRRWYRVRGKILQRATLGGAGDETIFAEFRRIEPLHPRLFREGFREEIAIERSPSGFAIADVLIKPFPQWREILRLMMEEGIGIGAMGSNALSLRVHFPRCEQADLAGALLTLKAFALAANEWTLSAEESGSSAAEGFPRFYHLARTIVAESIAPEIDPPPAMTGE